MANQRLKSSSWCKFLYTFFDLQWYKANTQPAGLFLSNIQTVITARFVALVLISKCNRKYKCKILLHCHERLDYRVVINISEKKFREMRQKLMNAIESGDEKQLESTMKEFKAAGVPDPNNLYERAERDLAIIRARRGKIWYLCIWAAYECGCFFLSVYMFFYLYIYIYLYITKIFVIIDGQCLHVFAPDRFSAIFVLQLFCT